MLPSINNSNIEPGYRSDHSMPITSLKFNEFKKGKGLWKFNNSLLYDIEYIDNINKLIFDIKRQYAIPIYNFENLKSISDEYIQFQVNDQLFLETLLIEIRGKTISHSSYRKKQQDTREKSLRDEIQELEDQDNLDFEKIEEKKEEIKKIRQNKLKGSIIRSKAKWLEEGEKPTNYFLNLENRNFTSKTIPKVEKENGDVVSKQEEILKEAKLFYEKIYTIDKDIEEKRIEDFLKNVDVPKLNNSEADDLEGLLTHKEAANTLKKMKNNKSPGSDGFTVEFFKCFWKMLGHFIVRSINYGYIDGHLSVTQRQGVITCLPKGDKPKQFLKNWRPISLLNVIYKIGSGSIANRIKNTLDKLINHDQTGFISGRYIGENSRLIYDVMQFAEENDLPGMLLVIDFEKAFDSVSWKFINNVLDYFKFGEGLKKWVNVLNKNANSAINQAGFLSSFFEIERGCRQGDPISPYIFILCAEVLAIRIRNNKNIKGINVDNYPILISQYADDTSLILDGSKLSLKEAMTELKEFYKISGLKMNSEKTQIIWIGNKKHSDEIFYPEWNLKWGNTKFILLGIDFHVDLHLIPKINFDKKLVKLKSLIQSWKRRILTPIGRVQVIKSLLISQFNHLFISLPNPDESFLQKLNTELFHFLWNSKVDKIKREIVIKKHSEGGLNMVHIQSFIDSLKLTWVRRLFSSNSKWQAIIKTYIDLDRLANCGTDYILQCEKNCKNLFWKDVFKAWLKLEQKNTSLGKTKESMLKMPIWHNKLFKVENKSVFYRDWFKNGILIVDNLIKKDNTLYSFQEFRQSYNIQTNFLQYQGIATNIRRYISQHDLSNVIIQRPFIPIYLNIFLKSKKGAKDFYNILRKNETYATGRAKWEESFDFNNDKWIQIYKTPFLITDNTKLQWFQYRVNQHILTTNAYLFRTGIVESPYCPLCNQEVETIEHALWECDKIQDFFHTFEFLIDSLFIPFRFNKETFLFGNHNYKEVNNRIDNEIIITMKLYIYKTRCLQIPLSNRALINTIKEHYNIQKYIINSKNEIKKTEFQNKWKKWQTLLDIP